MKHLELTDLVSYADRGQTESGRRKIAAHLASCQTCRSRFISLQTLKTAVRQIPAPIEELPLTSSCIPADLMGDFLGKRLPAHEQSSYSSHIASCDNCFERASFMASETVKMTAGVLAMTRTPDHFKAAVLPKTEMTVEEARRASFFDAVRRWVFSPVPAYGFAAVLVLFLVFGPGKGGNVTELAHDPMFTLYEQPPKAGPSFGFADAGKKVGESAAGLAMTPNRDGSIHFTWQALSGGGAYSFVIRSLTDTGPAKIFSEQVETNEIVVPAEVFKAGVAYEWRVSGVTKEDTIFTGAGKFGIAQ